MANQIPLIVNAGAGQIQQLATGDNLSVAGNVITNGILTDGYYYANGTPVSFGSNYGNANVAEYLPTFTGNLAGNNISVTGNVYTDGKILHLGEITGNGITANGAGIVVGANVATILYDNSVFGWTVNEGWHPAANVTYNLGRTTRYWNNFYAVNVNAVDVAISNSITSGNFIGNLSNGTSKISIASSGNVSIGVGPFSTTVLNVNTSTGISVLGNVVASEYISATGNVTGNYIFGNGSQLTGLSSTYGNTEVAAYLDGSAGNIIPGANLTYSLGNSTNWWSNIWVAGNTIYIGGIPLGMGAGNVLTVDGNAVLQNNSNSSISTTGNITADYLIGNISTTGNIYAADINLTGNVYGSNGNLVLSANIAQPQLGWLISNDNPAYAGPNNSALVTPLSDDIHIGEILFQATTGSAITTFAGPNNGPFSNAFNIISTANLLLTTQGNGNAYIWTFGDDGRLLLPNNGTINTSDTAVDIGSDNSISLEANTVVNIYTDTNGAGYQWQFGDDGNLTLPGNTFAVNYANGTPVSIGGGGNASTGNVTFDNQIVIGTGSNDGGGGLYLAPGNDSIANSEVQYLRVRGGDYPTHIHLDTGNNQYYDQYFGADDKFVKLEANGNVLINASNLANNSSATWTFDDTGDVTIPGNIQSVTTGFPFSSNISGINTGSPTVIVTLVDSVFGAPETGQVTITGVGGAVEANNTWYYLSIDPSNFQLYYDQALTNPVDGTTWTAYVGGGLAVALGYSNLAITGGNVSIITNNGNTWTFDATGNLTLPNNTFAVNYANGTPVTIGGGANTGNITFVNTTISAPNDTDINIQALNNDGVISSGISMRPGDTYTRLEQWGSQDSNSWTTADWSTGIYTTQGGGTIGAVEFTNAANIIDFVNSLQGVGQIYFSVNGGPQLLWDGTSSGGGGITFYTPTLPDTDPTTVTSFEYFYSYSSRIEIDYDSEEFNIEANNVDLNLLTTNQNDIELNSSRDMTLISNGTYSLTNYGNTEGIYITTDANDGIYQWTFGVDGNLTLPLGGTLYSQGSTPSGAPGNTIILQPSGSGTITNQKLMLYPTAGDGDHLHMVTGNLYETELFLGSDNFYVKLANTGNVVINSNDDNGNISTWTFGADGYLTFPRDATGNTDPYLLMQGGPTPTIQSVDVSLAGPANLRIVSNYLEMSGSTGNTVTIYADTGEISASDYLVLTANTAGNTNSWLFDPTGSLTLPPINLGGGTDEQTVVQSQRKRIPSFRWSAVISGNTPTVVYTATNALTTSMKVTVQVQHSGLGMELFDVSATYTGADTYYTVSNRVAPPTIAASAVVVDLNGSNTMQITITIDSGATTSWVTYDAVEFGIPND